MNNFFQMVMHLIFIASFSFFFVLAVILLKPLRFHKKRKISTAAFKFSYLFYLAVFLVFAYLFLFYREIPQEEFEENLPKIDIESVLILFSFFVPNVSMLLRRKFKKMRTQYNYIFSVINILITMYLGFLLSVTEWVFT